MFSYHRTRSILDESWRLGGLHGRNVHRVGTDFVEKVTACRWVNDASKDSAGDLAEAIEFRCSFRGKEQQDRLEEIRELLQKTDSELSNSCGNWSIRNPKVLLFFPASQFPREAPEFGAKGWWYEAREMCYVQRCNGCGQQKMPDEFGRKRGLDEIATQTSCSQAQISLSLSLSPSPSPCDSDSVAEADGSLMFPEVLRPAPCEGISARLIIPHVGKVLDGAPVGKDVEEAQELPVNPPVDTFSCFHV